MAKPSSWGGKNRNVAEQKKGIRQWFGPWTQILEQENGSLAETNSDGIHPLLSECWQPIRPTLRRARRMDCFLKQDVGTSSLGASCAKLRAMPALVLHPRRSRR